MEFSVNIRSHPVDIKGRLRTEVETQPGIFIPQQATVPGRAGPKGILRGENTSVRSLVLLVHRIAVITVDY